MKKVGFDKLFIEGFGAIHSPLSFDLDRGGVWLVKGDNGGGKTTIFSALCWALYRVNLKDVANSNVGTWEENRLDTYRGTRVIVQFNIGDNVIMVARHLDFKGTTKGLKGGSKLMVFRKEFKKKDFTQTDLVGENLHKGDMQDYINDILGMGSKMFLNSVLFGQRMKRLVEVDNAEKRKLFEDLFDLEFIQYARDNGKALKEELVVKRRELDVELSKCQTTIEHLNSKYSDDQKLLGDFEETLAMAKAQLDEDIVKTTTYLSEHKKEVGEANKRLENLQEADDGELRKKYAEAQEEKNSIDRQIKELEFDIKSVDRETSQANQNMVNYQQELDNVEDTCPYCKEDLAKEKVKKVKAAIQKKIKAEKSVLNALSKKLNPLHPKLEKLQKTALKQDKSMSDLHIEVLLLNKVQKDINDARQKVNSLDTEVAILEERLKGYQKNGEELKLSKPPNIDLESIKKRIAEQETLEGKCKVSLQDLQEEVGLVTWWMSKGFGHGGIKAFVFNAMLAKLNSYVEKYAQRLGVYVRFSVDLSKVSKPFVTTCYKNGKEIDYKELSGGEKQRIDIALAFAMHDLVSHSSKVNLLVMDECFEGLDGEGIESAFDLIRVKCVDKKTVFVISHSMIIDSLNSKTIEVYKDKQGNSVTL